MTRKEEIQFNDGVWFAIQTIIVDYDEPTIARHILSELKIDKKEMRRCQKKSGYLDEIMREFINNC
jgi:hypothetical protein